MCVCFSLLVCCYFFPLFLSKIHLLYFGALHLTIDGRSSDMWNFHTIHAFLDSFSALCNQPKFLFAYYAMILYVFFELRNDLSLLLFVCVLSISMCVNADNFCIYPPLFKTKNRLLKTRDSTVVVVHSMYTVCFFFANPLLFSLRLCSSLSSLNGFVFLCKSSFNAAASYDYCSLF